MDFFRENRFAKEVFLLYNQESKKICAEQESPELATACLEKRKMAFGQVKDILLEHRKNEREGETILLDRKTNIEAFSKR